MKNIKHTKRDKGFEKGNFLDNKDLSLSNNVILNEITNIDQSSAFQNLSQKDKEIIAIIIIL